jgi:hypothetical protein
LDTCHGESQNENARNAQETKTHPQPAQRSQEAYLAWEAAELIPTKLENSEEGSEQRE